MPRPMWNPEVKSEVNEEMSEARQTIPLTLDEAARERNLLYENLDASKKTSERLRLQRARLQAEEKRLLDELQRTEHQEEIYQRCCQTLEEQLAQHFGNPPEPKEEMTASSQRPMTPGPTMMPLPTSSGPHSAEPDEKRPAMGHTNMTPETGLNVGYF